MESEDVPSRSAEGYSIFALSHGLCARLSSKEWSAVDHGMYVGTQFDLEEDEESRGGAAGK